ncbi:MAG TPA: ATP-dependent DNA helicase RecG [Candidatus Aminicenantes bacterium]|nr:ATP-dependent DNA helicase RecG [Candidatus Aminicenantes bacterium]
MPPAAGKKKPVARQPLTERSPVLDLPGVGPQTAGALAERAIVTVGDLLTQFPVDYLDLSRPEPQPVEGVPGVYRVELGPLSRFRLPGRRRAMVKAAGRVGDEPVLVYFFNQPYVAGLLAAGGTLTVYGTFTRRNGTLAMSNPRLFPAGEEGLLPCYRSIGKVPAGRLRRVIAAALERAALDADPLPESLRTRRRLPDRVEAFAILHGRPDADGGARDAARQRFAYGELLEMQLELQWVRQRMRQRPRAFAYHLGREAEAELDSRFPFPLTAGQSAALGEILADLRRPTAMRRLVQGDVGCGKTLVALAAMFLAARAGHQAVCLSPTELLAEQSFSRAQRFLEGISTALLTGSTPTAEAQEIAKGVEAGRISVVFGTHALLAPRLRIPHLALAVIDEQHRFGVNQRTALLGKSPGADLLVMTATPIPRTLQLAMFGDLAVSEIRDLPPGRLPVETRVVADEKRTIFYRWLQKRVAMGQRGYIVLPLIDPSETQTEWHSLVGEEEALRRLFGLAGIRFISGRTDALERRQALEGFAAGEVGVLAATTVIEVGLDVPAASFVVIENADRYGLAQLHQLRGRVGRGTDASACYLIASPRSTPAGRQRLESLTRSSDGFALAETDLDMRGGGLVLGAEQAGELALRFADPVRDLDLLMAAQRDAAALLAGRSRGHDLPPSLAEILADVDRRLAALAFG